MTTIQPSASSASPDSPAVPAVGGGALGTMGTDDFLKLLIAQLRTQDPLEPVRNEELLRQIASIRDIELSTTITESLRALTGQERFTSASALIGQFVTSVPGQDGTVSSGIVLAVRFVQGRPVLQLADGAEIPLDRIDSIQPPAAAAEALVGQKVAGVDRRDPAKPETLEGVVISVRVESAGEVTLELDSGHSLRLRDVVSVASASAADAP